ncbi:DMT family transporter [Exilibacterium tricleocarpae]|uniref:DMT family transporter n=1 Tax=Exilibacterium tricleocarpae TaxID=2591008 RepID=A0A545TS39_9GAMM|nr:DMT family transporter [Exilibacterium tricleocarpae]TQV80034.1 DMT family transporter [Exilibacterium tricleocarpae]
MTERRAELSLVAVTLVAAAGWVFTKFALAGFTPYAFLSIRFAIAAAALALFCWPALRRLQRRQCLRSLTTGAVMGLALLIWIQAIDRTPYIGEGAFIVSLAVVAVPVLGRLLFGDKISIGLVIALVPALAGLAMLSLDQGFHLAPYQLYFLASMLAFALHLNLSSHYVRGIPSLPLATLQLLTVSIISAIAALATETWPREASATAWFWLLCAALIATSLRFALQTSALQHLKPSHASMIFLAEPVWTAVLGALLLGEVMSANQIAGCVLIFTSLLIFRGGTALRLWRR